LGGGAPPARDARLERDALGLCGQRSARFCLRARPRADAAGAGQAFGTALPAASEKMRLAAAVGADVAAVAGEAEDSAREREEPRPRSARLMASHRGLDLPERSRIVRRRGARDCESAA